MFTCKKDSENPNTVKFQIEDALLLNFSSFGARFYSKILKFYVVKFTFLRASIQTAPIFEPLFYLELYGNKISYYGLFCNWNRPMAYVKDMSFIML